MSESVNLGFRDQYNDHKTNENIVDHYESTIVDISLRDTGTEFC